MKSNWAFLYIFSALLIFSLACSEIERDNILDPKNNSSTRESVVVLEAFINTSDSVPSNFSYNFDALEAIDSLKEIYGKRLIVCEFHWDTSNPKYTDPLSMPLNKGEEAYLKYTSGYDANRSFGVPDLFVNGAANRVQGASGASNVIKRVQTFARDIIIVDSPYTIETDFTIDGNMIEGKYRVARLGDKKSDKMLMRILITEDNAQKGKNTVSQVSLPEAIDNIGAGNFIENDFSIMYEPQKSKKIIFILMDEDGFEVLSAIEKEL